MRLRFRFTVRRLMVMVALSAGLTLAGMWVREMVRYSRDYQAVADRRESIRVLLVRFAKSARNPASRRAYEQSAAWYETNRDVFARAAWTPWVTVPDDHPPDLNELLRAR